MPILFLDITSLNQTHTANSIHLDWEGVDVLRGEFEFTRHETGKCLEVSKMPRHAQSSTRVVNIITFGDKNSMKIDVFTSAPRRRPRRKYRVEDYISDGDPRCRDDEFCAGRVRLTAEASLRRPFCHAGIALAAAKHAFPAIEDYSGVVCPLYL